MPAKAREADPCVLAGIFSDHRADLPAAGLPPSLLSDLMDQVRCDALSFAGYDSDQRAAWFVQGVPVDAGWDDDDLSLVHWKHFWDCASCSYPDRSGDLRSITKISDLLRPAMARHRHAYRLLPATGPRARPVPLAARVGALGRSRRTVRLFLLRGPGWPATGDQPHRRSHPRLPGHSRQLASSRPEPPEDQIHMSRTDAGACSAEPSFASRG